MIYKLIKLIPLFGVVLMLSACGGNSKIAWNGHDITGVMPDLAYNLTNEKDKPATAADYAGKIRLVFFGYTSCPDICPVTLGNLKTAIASLPPAEQKQLRVLFVSVDPKRDTPKKLADYTHFFGPAFEGLTGTQKQLKMLTKRYRVTYGYGEPEKTGFYLVSHSSAIFVFGPTGKARLLLNSTLTPDQITADLRELFKQTG